MTTLRISDGRARLTASPTGTCRVCGDTYAKFRSTQTICAKLRCATQVGKLERKAEKAETKRRKEAAKPRGQYMKEAQSAFNKFIRLRDSGKPCICCGRRSLGPALGGDMDAGHYRSRGAAAHLRFDERNVHAQLKHCNRYAFDVTSYRNGLIGRIGAAAVAALEADNTPRKFTIPDLISIRDEFRAKAKELER